MDHNVAKTDERQKPSAAGFRVARSLFGALPRTGLRFRVLGFRV